MLSLFSVGPRVGLNALKEVLDFEISTAPVRHLSFLYWNAFLIAGCPEVWDDFAFIKNNEGSIRDGMRDVKATVSKDQWEQICRVIGHAKPPNSRVWGDSRTRGNVWTRGGIWDRRSNFTKIIIFGQHLSRSYAFNTWSWKLGERGAAVLAKELQYGINQELVLHPVCMRNAVEAVRLRAPQMLGYVNMRSGYEFASWFFQTNVQNPDGYNFTYRYPDRRPCRRWTKEGHLVKWDLWP